jgi:hypothetical protein
MQLLVLSLSKYQVEALLYVALRYGKKRNRRRCFPQSFISLPLVTLQSSLSDMWFVPLRVFLYMKESLLLIASILGVKDHKKEILYLLEQRNTKGSIIQSDP